MKQIQVIALLIVVFTGTTVLAQYEGDVLVGGASGTSWGTILEGKVTQYHIANGAVT